MQEPRFFIRNMELMTLFVPKSFNRFLSYFGLYFVLIIIVIFHIVCSLSFCSINVILKIRHYSYNSKTAKR